MIECQLRFVLAFYTKCAHVCANTIFIEISKDDLQILCKACGNHIPSNIIH